MIRPRTLFIGVCLRCVIALITAIRFNSGREAEREPQEDIAGLTAASPTNAPSRLFQNQIRRPRIQTIAPTAEIPPAELESASKALANELIVKLKPGATNIDELAASSGAQVAGRMDKLNAYRLQFADDAAAAAAREQLAANSEVESLDSNYAITRPPGGEEIGSSSESQAKLTVKPGDSDGKLVVGLIDTAVQIENSGLNESFFLPSISVAGESSLDANSLSHGTSMAETLLQGLSAVEAGKTETSVRILSVDVYGNSETTSTYQVAEGIVKAIEGGATIINLSLGSDGDSSVLQQVIADGHAQGIIFLSAAGNESTTTATYPAAYSQVIAVTATDAQGNIAAYANYGDFVDIATPGTVIVNYNGKSYLVTGTSTSAALASGAAAGLAEKTGTTAAKIEETIRKGLAVP